MNTDTAPGATTLSRTSTEQAFIDVATRLFAEKGYKETSISDLARELRLTTASMYYYVQGKQELLGRVLEGRMAELLARLEQIVAGGQDPRTLLTKAVENHIDFVLANRDVVRIFFRYRDLLDDDTREHHRQEVDRYEEQFTAILATAAESGAIVPSDPTMLRLALLGMVNSMTEWYRPDGRLPPEQMRTQLVSLIMSTLLRAP